MRFMQLIRLLIIGLALAVLAACGAHREPYTVVPDDISSIQATAIGELLKERGYTPVASQYREGEVVGYIFVVCDEDEVPSNLSECGIDRHNRSTAEHPNVYVIDDKIVFLEGPRMSSTDDRRYHIIVPEEFQAFDTLTPEDQDALLGIMPEVIEAIGDGMTTEGGWRTLSLSIGQTEATLTRRL